jgi:hypothetical protein
MSADTPKAISPTMSNLPPLVEEDESAMSAPAVTSPEEKGKLSHKQAQAQSRLPYVKSDANKPPPPPEVETYPPEVEFYWRTKLNEAKELYDTGLYAEAIVMLRSFLDDPQSPDFCRIRFMILLGTCYPDYEIVEFWVKCSFYFKNKSWVTDYK